MQEGEARKLRAGVGYILVAFIIIFYIIPISLTYAVLSVPALEDTDLYRASPWKCAGPSLSAPRARALSRRVSNRRPLSCCPHCWAAAARR